MIVTRNFVDAVLQFLSCFSFCCLVSTSSNLKSLEIIIIIIVVVIIIIIIVIVVVVVVIIIIIIIIINNNNNRFYLTHPLYMVLRSNITFTQYSHTHT